MSLIEAIKWWGILVGIAGTLFLLFAWIASLVGYKPQELIDKLLDKIAKTKKDHWGRWVP